MDAQVKQGSRSKQFETKEEFIVWLKNRTKAFALRVIQFCDSLPKKQATQIISYQLIKSATSTASNYRAACRGRFSDEFYFKLCVVVEEADETVFWLEVIKESAFEVDHRRWNICYRKQWKSQR